MLENSDVNRLQTASTEEAEVIDLRDSTIAAAGHVGVGGEVDEGIIDKSEQEVALARKYEPVALSSTDLEPLEEAISRRKAEEQTAAEVEHMKKHGYVMAPPRYEEILGDTTRTMPFCWCVQKHPQETYANTSEMDGLAQLYEFLSGFIASVEEKMDHLRKGQELRVGHYRADKIHSLYDQAKSIREDLTFIGWPEYQRAVKGIGAYWRDLLDQNPDMQICIPSAVAELNRYQKFGTRKSDDALLEDVLLTFTDDELKAYGTRIVRRLDDITHTPENTKIILLDDWVISGGQLRDTYRHIIKKHPKGESVVAVNNVEAHMLVAQEERIKYGLALNPYKPRKGTLPVVAFYKAHGVHIVTDRNSGSHISGQHSAVNYDFYDPIIEMEKLSSQLGMGRPRIALARVEPWYRHPDVDPAITFQNGYAERVRKKESSQDERAGA